MTTNNEISGQAPAQEANVFRSEKSVRYGKDIIWNTIGHIIYLFTFWLITVFITRRLGFEVGGVFSLCIVTGNVVFPIGSFYLRLFYGSDITGKYKDNDYLWATVLLTTLSFVFCFVYSAILQYSWDVIGCIMLFYVYRGFELVANIYGGTMQRYGKAYWDGVYLTIRGFVGLGLAVLLVFLTNSLIFGILGLAAANVVGCMFEIVHVHKSLSVYLSFKEFDMHQVMSLIGHCAPLFVVLVCANYIPSIPKIAFEKIYGTEALGYYNSMANITVIIQTFASAAVVPLVPKYSAMFKEKRYHSFAKWVVVVFVVIIAIGIAGFLLALWIGDWFLNLLFGADILDYSYVFKWAIVGAVFCALTGSFAQILASVQEQRGNLIGSIGGLILSLSLSYVFCINWGMSGASFVLILAYGAEFLVFVAFILYRLKKDSKNHE